jgi:hypothetical protein
MGADIHKPFNVEELKIVVSARSSGGGCARERQGASASATVLEHHRRSESCWRSIETIATTSTVLVTGSRHRQGAGCARHPTRRARTARSSP